ncbi:MAG TPA: DUF1634 domain-containing protein [Nostocaceae cyanobacterium]|nr:DUF1634 domain-containing protein [Nostocaceae cyanobacterium]
MKPTQTDVEAIALTLPPEEPDSDIQQLETQLSNNCEVETEQDIIKIQAKIQTEKKLEYLLSNLLKYGVLIASVFVLFGGILYLFRHYADPVEYQFFHGTPSELRSPIGVFNAVLAGSSLGVIQFGLLLLILTPILRVVISLLTFLLQREFIYVIITGLVLASLTYSLVGAYY